MAIDTEAEKRAYQKFIAAGMTAAGACGLIGNLEAESDGFKPTRVEYLCLKRLKENGKTYTDATYTAAVDDGSISCESFLHPLPGKQYGYGLAQWTSPSRKSGLYNLAKEKNVSIGNEDMQIEFLLSELKTSYKLVLQTLKTATSIRAASDVVLKKFECPANTGETVCASRATRGQTFYDNYVKSSTSSTSTSGTGGTSTVSLISNCGHDENNKYSGGAAGDQTGGEWSLISWYSRPWNCVLRHPDATVRNLHASMAKAAAQNDNIGYDQNQRDTFGVQLKAAGDDPAKITVKCETDCSKGIIDITKAIGRKTGRSELQNISATYTGNMRSAYKAAGYQVLTASKYLTSADYLLPGDILLNDQHHVATNIQQGSKASTVTISSATGTTTTTTTKSYLSKGDTGTAVKTMQTMLIACGYSCGSAGADGDFGNDTESALKSFQKAYNLTVDGLYGSASKTALEKAYKTATGSNSSSGSTSSSGKLSAVPKWVGKVIANKLAVRVYAGTTYAQIKSYPILAKGNLIDVCDTVNDSYGAKWYYVRIAGRYYGFVCARYVEKV